MHPKMQIFPSKGRGKEKKIPALFVAASKNTESDLLDMT
jgi:hypothetical protein